MLNTAQPMMTHTTPSQIHHWSVWLPWLCRRVMYAGWPLESVTAAHRGARYSLMAMAVRHQQHGQKLQNSALYR